jgi:nucleotide-binding universal stress UspA family protein
MIRRALICVRGFGIAPLLDRATELLPDGLTWTIVHVIDQRPEEELERAIGHLPGRRPHHGAGLDRIQRSVEQLQRDVQYDVEVWLHETGRTAELAFLYGVPEHEIVALASELPAEVVVVGARPEIVPHRFGHVSRFVIDHVPCSVLVIAPDPASHTA